jgi:hypothetical protein
MYLKIIFIYNTNIYARLSTLYNFFTKENP